MVCQAYGADFFQALMMAIQGEGLILNMKDLVGLMNLFVQLTPSGVWASHFHSSGLFAWILDKLVENEVCHPNARGALASLTKCSPVKHHDDDGIHIPFLSDRHGRSTGLPPADLGCGCPAQSEGKLLDGRSSGSVVGQGKRILVDLLSSH